MWMIGSASKKEVKEIRELGYYIDRMVTVDELNKFVEPNITNRKEPNAKDMPLIWIDEDVLKVLLNYHKALMNKEI